MRTRWTISVLSLTLAIFMLTGAGPKAGPAEPGPVLTTLEPGGFRNIPQTLDVNVVFLGYNPGATPLGINLANFSNVLPTTYRPIHRYPAFYGIRQEMGLTFQFNYKPVFTSDTYENAFFAYLSSIAVNRPLTQHQSQYNGQAPRALTIVGNTWIDAPSAG